MRNPQAMAYPYLIGSVEELRDYLARYLTHMSPAELDRYARLRWVLDLMPLPDGPPAAVGSEGTAFYSLPPELWRGCDGAEAIGFCTCAACQPFPLAVRLPAFWDTLAVGPDGVRWAVHYPSLQPGFLPREST